jgi:hypothetical protein
MGVIHLKNEAAIGVLNLDVGPERIGPQRDKPGFLRNDET